MHEILQESKPYYLWAAMMVPVLAASFILTQINAYIEQVDPENRIVVESFI